MSSIVRNLGRTVLLMIIIMMVLAFYSDYIQGQQTMRIWHEGKLPQGWRNIPDGQSFSAILVSQEGLSGLSEEDRQVSEYLRFKFDGGARVEARPGSLQSFLVEYVNLIEYNDFLSSQKLHLEYVKEKYGDKLPPGIGQRKIGPHQTLVFSVTKTDADSPTGHLVQTHVAYYFVATQLVANDGMVIEVSISYVDGMSPFTLDAYIVKVNEVIANLRFSGSTTDTSNSNIQQGEPRPCKAAIHLPADLKPGEVLSPSYTITDLDGSAPKGEIYPLLYINGVQAHSVVWDGNEAKIELQVSCQGQALSVTAIMPAYGSPPPSAGTIPSDGFDSVIPPYDSTPDGLSKIPLPENAGQAMAGLVIPGILSIILGILGQSGAAVAPSGGSGSSKAKAGSAYDFGDSRDYYEGQSYTFDDGKKYKIVNGEFVPTMGLRDGEVYTDPDGNRKIWIVGQPWYETDWRRQAATNGKIAEPADDTGQLEADNKGVSTKSPETAGNGEAGNADFGSSSEATTEASPEAGQPGGERPMQETIERGRDQAGDAAEGLKGAASHLKDAQGRIKQLQDSGKDLKGLVSDLGIDPKSQAAINATVDEFNKEMGGLSTRLKNLEGMCSSAQEYAEAVKEVLERGGRVIEAYNNMHENLPPYIPEGLRAGVSTYGAAAQAAGEAVDKYVRSLPHGDKLADAFQTGELGRETNQALLTGVENVTHQQGKIYDEVIQPIDQQMLDNPWLDLNRDVPRDELGTYQTARGGNLSTEERHRNLANEGARARELKDAIDNRDMGYLKRHSPRDYERLRQEDLMEQRPAEFRYQGAKRIRERLRAGQPAYTEGELRQIEQSLGKEYAEWLQNQDYLRLPGRIDR